MHRTTGKNTIRDADGRPLFFDGPPGSSLPAKWLNSVQEEIANVIQAADIDLDVTQMDQLYQAISILLPSAVFPWYNAKTYGAIAESILVPTINQFDAFQDCIDAICNSAKGWGLMINEPGYYLIQAPLTIGGTAGVEDAVKCRNTRGFQWNGYNAGFRFYHISAFSGKPAIYFYAGPTNDNLDFAHSGGSAPGDWVKAGSDCPVMMYHIQNLYMFGNNVAECAFQTNHEGMEYIEDEDLELERQIKYGGKFEQIVVHTTLTGGADPRYIIVAQSAVDGSW